jgi:NAD(P)-dependent dehydrogenase (short-subunit alcohol dehydrogenase family)
VITGGASGIGLAAARRFAALEMNVVLADLPGAPLGEAAAWFEPHRLLVVPTDVSDYAAMQSLRARAFERFGGVAVLMCNAGIGNGGGPWENIDRWRAVLATNLMGVVHGIHAFAEAMIAQGTDAAIVSTGSKQGITTPPGDAAYNVSKAGVKVATEALAHALRQVPGCRVTAHLLIPGFVFTPLTRPGETTKPADAWTPEQTVDFMLDGLGRGDFYILCPDNAVTRAMDEKRIRWAAEDIIQNRPALSRWHPDFTEAFAAYMRG